MTAILRLLLTATLLVVMAAPNAYAACSSPAGVAGRMTYTSNILYYCNDTAWVPMKGASISSCAGTTGGTIRYVAYNEGSPTTTTGMHQFCDGTNWYSMRGTSLISSCLGEEGKLRYSAGGTTRKNSAMQRVRQLSEGISAVTWPHLARVQLSFAQHGFRPRASAVQRVPSPRTEPSSADAPWPPAGH